MELFFDTETSGFRKNAPADDPAQAWIMQFACVLSTEEKVFFELSTLIKGNGRTCKEDAHRIHGILLEDCEDFGIDESRFHGIMAAVIKNASLLVCHNFNFDFPLLTDLFARVKEPVPSKPSYCTMLKSTNLCKLPGKYDTYKWPTLEELHEFLFQTQLTGAHDALVDVRATRKCYYEMKRRGL